MRACTGSIVILTALLVAPTLASRAEAQAGDLERIPKAVRDALATKFPNATIAKWTKETERGTTIYDIEFTQGARKAEADIAEDGRIQNFEREFDAKDLPKAVTRAVEHLYPKSTMREVMEITEMRGGKPVHGGFEIVLSTADRKEVEVTVAKNGKVLEDSGAKKE
jgi:uncharacterized membrane protein YkoI